MRRKVFVVSGVLLLLAVIGSALVGRILGGGALHPRVRRLTPNQVTAADALLRQTDAHRQDFLVRAPDGVPLRGWKVRAPQPNGDWVLLYHGVSDNRTAMRGQAQLLLRHGFSIVMMDARAHGESGGAMATFGWLERRDSQAVADALYALEMPRRLFAFGSSMGAAIALQSAATDSRIAGVVAESPFSDLREVMYDYAGLRWSVWLGKTLFRPAVWGALPRMEAEGGFRTEEVSPEKAAAARPFPVLLICTAWDSQVPCRHTRSIFRAAAGPKELWEVPRAFHAAAMGAAPAEFERRVIAFLEKHNGDSPPASGARP